MASPSSSQTRSICSYSWCYRWSWHKPLIEISKIKGATVIATVGAEDKRKIAEEHGADFTINYNDGGFRKSFRTDR